jgi:hypothetical protein
VQLSVLSGPKKLSTLQHDLRTDERVVRWLIVKKKALPRLPKTKELRRIESELCAPAFALSLRTLLTRAREQTGRGALIAPPPRRRHSPPQPVRLPPPPSSLPLLLS